MEFCFNSCQYNHSPCTYVGIRAILLCLKTQKAKIGPRIVQIVTLHDGNESKLIEIIVDFSKSISTVKNSKTKININFLGTVHDS